MQVEGHRRVTHRIAYELFVGPVPTGLEIDHVCHSNDTSCPGNACEHRRCFNPDHLEAVDHRTNVLRGRRGADLVSRTHCPKGHEYTPENTKRWQNERHCKPCGSLTFQRFGFYRAPNGPSDDKCTKCRLNPRHVSASGATYETCASCRRISSREFKTRTRVHYNATQQAARARRRIHLLAAGGTPPSAGPPLPEDA